jgi:hypothetical protein
MGSILASSERAVSGLVQRLGSMDFVSDNAGNFGNKPFPRNGSFLTFSAHRVYVSMVQVCRHPEVVHVAVDPPAVCAARGRRTGRPASCVEVMTAGLGADVGKAATAEKAAGGRTTRSGKPAYERAENIAGQAGTSTTPIPNVLQASIDLLAMPVVSTTDLALAQVQLEE